METNIATFCAIVLASDGKILPEERSEALKLANALELDGDKFQAELEAEITELVNESEDIEDIHTYDELLQTASFGIQASKVDQLFSGLVDLALADNELSFNEIDVLAKVREALHIDEVSFVALLVSKLNGNIKINLEDLNKDAEQVIKEYQEELAE